MLLQIQDSGLILQLVWRPEVPSFATFVARGCGRIDETHLFSRRENELGTFSCQLDSIHAEVVGQNVMRLHLVWTTLKDAALRLGGLRLACQLS